MNFNSLAYLVFLPATIALYALLPQRWRWVFLLAASYFFYACWSVRHVVLLLLVTALTWAAALVVNASTGALRRTAIAAGVLAPLAILGLFKYSGFFAGSLNALPGVELPVLEFVLPAGISFYTFMGISYVIDVSRRRYGAEANLGHYALYLSFFPHLVAGPIMRVGTLLPQLLRAASATGADIAVGLRWIAWGLFKKVVVADNIAPYVEMVYGDPLRAKPLALAMATYLFAFQIYCDFSGYTDIATGSARCFGVRLSQNFFLPYLATSPRDFWHRWHITLSTWFRDYVYIPLGGNRGPAWRRAITIVITFVASGLWHGANWTFVLWGLVHGLALAAQRLLEPLLQPLAPLARRVPPALRVGASVAGTFLLINSFWVFFRAHSALEALRIYLALPRGLIELFANPVAALASLPGRALTEWQAAVVVLGIVVVVLSEAVMLRRMEGAAQPARPWLAAVPEAMLLAACVAFQPAFMYQFIYFQF